VAHPIPATQPTHSPIPTQAPPTLASAPSPTSAHAPQTPASPSCTACHPESSEGSHPNHAASTTVKTRPSPTTQCAQSAVPAAQPDDPPRTGPSTPQPAPDRVARALHFDHSCRLLIDGKPF
jgi:hypothetical protein